MEQKQFHHSGGTLYRDCPVCGPSIGALVVTMSSVAPPEPLKCIRFRCLVGYLAASLRYVLLYQYEQVRINYAQEHRDGDIPEYIRTGYNPPTTVWGTLRGIYTIQARR